MSVEKGADWGARARPPADLIIVNDSAAAVEIIAAERRASRPLPAIGLRGGDLVRTLGGPTAPDLASADEALQVTVDLGAVLVDGALHWFLDHLVARRSWLRGQVLVVADAAFVDNWNIAPRAHPGDGRFDALETSTMSLGARWQARSRVKLGTHVPHPAIATRRLEAAQYDFERPTPIRLDGRSVGDARHLSIRLEPDAVDIWI
ncbi:MAG TPA: hypothetical protein DEA70_04825 [Acidimicrobiaceae bacterium]|nr:hypothetical protein [Acidimicrobiaceae bacterium]